MKYTLNPATGQVPVMVTFTGTWTGDATKWTLSGTSPFVGSSGATQPATAIRDYSTPGVYDVTFTVTGADGKNYAVTETITATTVAPTADFTASATSGAAPLTVQFTDTSTPTGAITDWSWNFGDVSTSISTSNPNTSTAQNPQHTYNTPGTYPVRLEATNSQGATSKTASITVTEASASTDGLVAAYNFEEAGGNTVVDASGQGNHGTISGAARINSGKFGRALSFDGVDDWVTIPDADSLDLTNGMTLEAWVYPTDINNFRTVMMKESNAIYYLYASSPYNNAPGMGLNINGRYEIYGKALSTNRWVHLAATYDGTTQRLYVNGTQVASQSLSGTMQNTSNPLRIGGSSDFGEFFKGRIDEIRIYNRALSAAEINADMNTAVASSSPPKRLLGEEALGSVSDSLPQRTAAAFLTTAAATGQITNLSVYVDVGSAATRLIAGLYADSNGRPGALLATGTMSAPQAGSWNTVLLPATQVTAGARYWIAILSPRGELKFRSRAGSIAQPSETSRSTRLTSLPSTWATGTVSTNGPLSGYGAGY